LTDYVNNERKKLEKISKGFQFSLKNKKPELSKRMIDKYIVEVREMNIKIDFYLEMFLLLFDFALNNFIKGIIGLKIKSDFDSILSSAIFLKGKLMDSEKLFKDFSLEISEFKSFDKLFKTTIIDETKEYYIKFYEIFAKSIRMLDDYILVVEKVKNN